MRSSIPVSLGLLAMLTLSGCVGGQSPDAQPSEQATQAEETAKTSTDPSPDPEPSESESASTGTDSPDRSPSAGSASADEDPSGDSSGPRASGSPAVISAERKGETLVLDDFFNPDSNWGENRYSVAKQSDVAGMAHEVSTCGKSTYGDGTSLELRLANNFEKLNFKVGQDNESKESDQTLVVQVQGNGKQLDVQRIPFNKIQDFSVEVADVNAVVLSMYLDDEVEKCQGPVQAVLFDAELQ